MEPSGKTARLAGFLYLLVVVLNIITIEYIPSKIFIWKDPAATVRNIINLEMIFKWGIVISVFAHLCFISLPLVLYKLFKPVNKNVALVMVLLVLISIPVSYILLIKQLDILSLLNGPEYSKLLSASQIQAQVMFLIDSYYNGFQLSQIFWGLWLFPFGFLVFKSGFLPKILGIFLMLGCIGYLFDTIGSMLISNYHDLFKTRLIILPASIGEIGICLWLLIIGIKRKK